MRLAEFNTLQQGWIDHRAELLDPSQYRLVSGDSAARPLEGPERHEFGLDPNVPRHYQTFRIGIGQRRVGEPAIAQSFTGVDDPSANCRSTQPQALA